LVLQEAIHEFVAFGILASQRGPIDLMEKAFRDVGNLPIVETGNRHED
jgi:hypothetical protein